MRGLPKFYNTKQDVLNAIELFGDEAIQQLKRIYENRFVPKFVKLAFDESNQLQDGEFLGFIEDNKPAIFKYVEDKNHYLANLGFTDKELSDLGIK